ncbi:hypothetical protein RDABS01_027299 [Bienertia sinuspersici]
MMHPHPSDNTHPPQVRRLTKLLLSVTVQGCTGQFQIIMSPENTVGELIKAVLEMYMKEKRRPLLSENQPNCFELHYSPFSLQSKAFFLSFFFYFYFSPGTYEVIRNS